MATAKKKGSAAALAAKAQPTGGQGTPPVPKQAQSHRWNTMDEYAAQVNMPCHRITSAVIVDGDGVPGFETTCGLRLGSVLLRTTDVSADVTCLVCKKKRR